MTRPMRPSDQQIRIVAALIAGAGLVACGAAIFAEQLGLGAEASRGSFGWKRASLLASGGVALLAGGLLFARPRALARLIEWVRSGPSEHGIRLAGGVIAVAGLAACGVAIFSEQLGLGAEESRGTFGWKRISLLVVGAVVLAAGWALMARPQLVFWAHNRESVRAWIGSLSYRQLGFAGTVILLGGLAICGLALFARPIGVTPLTTAGVVGGRQIALLLVGGLIAGLGTLLIARAVRFPRRIELVALLCVGGVYTAVQIALLKPPELSDQLDYFSTADQLPDVTANHRHLRLGLLFPVRGFIELFGYSEAAYYAVPLLAGLALAGFTYAVGRMLFGWAVGVAAALLVTLNPYVLWDSSHLLPDVPGAAAFAGAIAALVAAGILHQRPRAGRWAIALLVGGGFLLGWAYLTREYLLVMFPLALVVFLAYRIPWRRLGWVALGATPPLALEAVWGAANYGDPLIRVTTSTEPQRAPLQEPEAVPEWQGTGDFIVTDAWDVLWQLPSLFLDSPGGWVFVALFSAVVLYGIIAAIRGDRRFWPIVAWVGGIWLALTAIGMVPIVLTDGEALLRLQVFRYWLPIMPGLVIGGLAAVYALVQVLVRGDSWPQPLGAFSLAAITVLTASVGISSISDSPTYLRNGSDQYLQLRDFLRDDGASYSSLYTDHGAGASLALVVSMYTRSTFGSPIWDGQIRKLAENTEFLRADEIEGDLVVVRPQSIRWLVTNREDFSPPRYLLDPPPGWEPVLISDNGDIVAYAPNSLSPPLHTVSAGDWHIIRQRGAPRAGDLTIENGRAVIEVSSETPAYVFDGRGEHFDAPDARDEPLIDPGEVVWGRIQMTTDDLRLGDATIRCYFYDEGGVGIPAAAVVRDPYAEGSESIDYRCSAPPTGGPFQVRVALFARQGVTLRIGENLVSTEQGRTDR